MADWIKVTEDTLNKHIELAREGGEVFSRHFRADNITVYYQGGDDVFEQQWIGKVSYHHEKPCYYIADGA